MAAIIKELKRFESEASRVYTARMFREIPSDDEIAAAHTLIATADGDAAHEFHLRPEAERTQVRSTEVFKVDRDDVIKAYWDEAVKDAKWV